MSVDHNFRGTTLAARVAGKRSVFHSPMNSRLFEGFQGGGLRVREARFDAALGEGPSSIPRLHQQEFDSTAADPVADGGNLFRAPQFAKFRSTEELGR
jgi:hypothetical protein